MTNIKKQSFEWWKQAVFYQIYPRSFYDADNNGIGDIKGITCKMDYLNDGKGGGLGIEAIWISPFFKSPMLDFGYDVSDYCDIDPIFGTLDDFDEMVDAAHQRGIKIVIDLVLNHTSSQHAWFQESKQDKTNPKADWYVWADPSSDGGPPNNWLSIFSGPAWTFDEQRQQYYFHNFLKEQPDLNWYNPEVKNAIAEIVRFWIHRGCDGFRLDTANFYAYDRQLRDNPLNPDDIVTVEDTDFNPFYNYDTIYSKDRPENLEFVEFLRSLFDEGHEITSIGEIGGIQDLEKVIQVAADHGKAPNRLHMAYTFSLLNERSDVDHIARVVEITESKMTQGWPCWSLGNHDITRIKTRYGCTGNSAGLNQTFLLLLLTLRGTPVLYYGDEIDMEEADITREQVQDPYGIRFWPEFRGRDGCRTPFAWDMSLPNQGFNNGTAPWLPANSTSDLKTAQQDPKSTFHVVQEIIRLRKKYDCLTHGSYRKMVCQNSALVFERQYKDKSMIIGANLSPTKVLIPLERSYADIRLKHFEHNGMVTNNILELPGMGFYMGIGV